MEHEIVIIGGGPAGAGAAIHLARAGLSPLVIDRAAFPRAKACGEGLLPPAVKELNRCLGEERASELGSTLIGVALHFVPREREHNVFFESAAPGKGVERFLLDQALVESARNDGATILEKSSVRELHWTGKHFEFFVETDDEAATGWRRARFVIVAAGTFGTSENRIRRVAGNGRFGLSTHIQDPLPERNMVDVFVRENFEIYTSGVGGGKRVVSILAEKSLGGGKARILKSCLDDSSLPPWLRDSGNLVDEASIIGAAGFASYATKPEIPLILVGDALSSSDPAAAQGIYAALASGRIAAESIISGIDSTAVTVAERYFKRALPLARETRRRGAILRSLARHPRAASRIFTLLEYAGYIPFLRRVRRRVVDRFIHGAVPEQRPKVLEEKMDTMPKVPDSTFRFLSLVNRFGGGLRATSRRIAEVLEQSPTPQSAITIDVGAGDGAMIEELTRWLQTMGFSITPIALEQSAQFLQDDRRVQGVHFVVGDATRLPFRNGSSAFVISSLLFHHLSPAERRKALAESGRVARHVIVNDLLRSRIAFVVTRIVTLLLGDPIVRHDGPVSVLRSFTENEIKGWDLSAYGQVSFRKELFFRFTLLLGSFQPEQQQPRPGASQTEPTKIAIRLDRPLSGENPAEETARPAEDKIPAT